jgi:hypothetical protein
MSKSVTTIIKQMGNAMKTLIVYDSVYGNTEKIAKATVNAITGEAKVLRVSEVNSSNSRHSTFSSSALRPTEASRRERFKPSLRRSRRLLSKVLGWQHSILDSP